MSNRVEVCRILLRQGRYEVAEKEIGRMLAEDPESDDAHCLMAWCMSNTGRFKEAHEAANHAIRIAPESSYSYYMKAAVYRDEASYKKSLPFYRRAISLNPNPVYYYWELSNALLKLGRKKDALATAKRGLRLNPKDVDCHNARTDALKALNREKEALKSAEKTLALDPQNAKAFRLKGEIHLNHGHLDEADTAIRQSLKLQPVNPGAQKVLGLVDEKLDEMLGEYLDDHKSFKRVPWIVLACLLLGAITHNGAGLMAVLLLMWAKEYGVERLKHRPGSRRHGEMGKFFPFLAFLGILALVFFGTAVHWYSDRTAWFFTVFFFFICTSPKEYFDEQSGIRFEPLAYSIGGVLFGVGLFSLSLVWVLASLNWFWLFHVVQRIEYQKTNFDSRLRSVTRIAAVPLMLWVISDLLGTWELTHPWYGNESLWCEEIICLVMGAFIGGYIFEDKPDEKEQAVNSNPVPTLSQR